MNQAKEIFVIVATYYETDDSYTKVLEAKFVEDDAHQRKAELTSQYMQRRHVAQEIAQHFNSWQLNNPRPLLPVFPFDRGRKKRKFDPSSMSQEELADFQKKHKQHVQDWQQELHQWYEAWFAHYQQIVARLGYSGVTEVTPENYMALEGVQEPETSYEVEKIMVS